MEGTLTLNEIEGEHFELVVTTGDEQRVYVLVPVADEVERDLAAHVGRRVRVSGQSQQGATIFMRGPVLRVTEVELV